jgi:hypothetical protein
MAEIESGIAMVSPARAEEILVRNTRNRNLRRDYVSKLAGAMTRGEWVVNGEPIQLAEDGTLLNGQHRLSAVVEAGVTVPMLIVQGLPAKSRQTMDAGTRRNLSDVLALHGEKDTTNLAAAIGLVHRYRNGERMDKNGRTAPTPAEALLLLEREPEIRGYVAFARSLFRPTRMRVSVGAALAYLFDEVDEGEGTQFFELLRESDQQPAGSPIRALRSILDRTRIHRSYKISNYILSGMTIKTFNAWREGRDIAVLSFRPGGATSEPFPEILTRDLIAGAADASRDPA